MFLEVKDLNVYYGAIHALQGVSFHIEEGEIVSLIGANGAGKSTTLRTVSGVLRPRNGHIFFKGEEITTTPAEQIVRKGNQSCSGRTKDFCPVDCSGEP